MAFIAKGNLRSHHDESRTCWFMLWHTNTFPHCVIKCIALPEAGILCKLKVSEQHFKGVAKKLSTGDREYNVNI